MPRHSKNRTANPVVSAQERQAFGYGSKKARLNGESFLSFDACRACLNRARQPVKVCDKGHVYCNECVITLLLSQKKDIKRHQAMIEKMKADEEAERQVARAMARERVLQDFEKSQGIRASNVDRNTYQKAMDSIEATEETRGVKRKFEMESSEVERLMLDSEERALRQLEREQADNRKSKLPSFWLPSLTPDAGPSKLMQEPKLSTLCKAADPPHPMTLKSLAQVRFAAPSSKLDEESTPDLKDDESYLCWACKRQLTNISRSHVLKPCGHVLCATCVDSLCKASKQCAACDKPVENFVQLNREGTGFAGAGQAEAKAFDLAFQ